MTIPVLIKIAVTFGMILVLSRFVPLYLSLLVGAGVIGVWMGKPAPEVVSSILNEWLDPQTIWLCVIIALILILSGLLRQTGQLDRMVKSFQKVSPGRRFTLAAMPALIGLLPMPGGALFSAPMVDTALESNTIDSELKVAINYWFRHIWEFWWPLYPGILLAISLFEVDSWKLILAQAPLTIGSIIGGLVFILRKVPPMDDEPSTASWVDLRRFFSSIAPIVVVIVVFLGLQLLLVGLRKFAGVDIDWPKYTTLALGLVLAIGLTIKEGSLGYAEVKSLLLHPSILPMTMIVLGIMAFKGALVSSSAIDSLRLELNHYNVPPTIIIALLPFVAGFVTGIAIGFVGASFPLVVTLIPPDQAPYAYAVLAFGFGFMGMMLSPVHLCLLVTKDYFAADLIKGYRFLYLPVLVALVWTALLYWVYGWAL